MGLSLVVVYDILLTAGVRRRSTAYFRIRLMCSSFLRDRRVRVGVESFSLCLFLTFLYRLFFYRFRSIG
jgi:hypothetical protein